MSISSINVCPDCGSKELKLEYVDRMKNIRLQGIPVAKCLQCGEYAVSDIVFAVYKELTTRGGMHRIQPNPMYTEYERAIMSTLKEPIRTTVERTYFKASPWYTNTSSSSLPW